jgi:hypothetical protein
MESSILTDENDIFSRSPFAITCAFTSICEQYLILNKILSYLPSTDFPFTSDSDSIRNHAYLC